MISSGATLARPAYLSPTKGEGAHRPGVDTAPFVTADLLPGDLWREPRREERTICTAVAPETVLTVRTYATATA